MTPLSCLASVDCVVTPSPSPKSLTPLPLPSAPPHPHPIPTKVRHPLRSIPSLTTFETMSWNFIAKHTPAVPGLAKMAPLRKALIHWVTWNRMVESYADFTFRMEDTTVAEVCHRVGLDAAMCDKSIQKAHRATREHDDVTWEQLFDIDPHFAREAMKLAHHYGYRDDLPLTMIGEDDDAE